MFTDICPKLPMRNKAATRDFYLNRLGFEEFGSADFEGYLMVQKDGFQIHFFEFADLDPMENYGQIYIRTDDIEALYGAMQQDVGLMGYILAALQIKPWGQKEFSLHDPDSNLLTFGQSVVL